MARPLRIEFAGAWYHVMNRGRGRQAIFRSDDHRRHFLQVLSDTVTRFDAEWHAYCLMDNHYHLMIRTPSGNLQRIMRHVNGVYTQYFNRATRTDGTLFRGRYKAILVDADTYWLSLSRYIHRNPLEARIVTDLAKYPWSSYHAYIGKAKPPEWLTTGYILDAVGRRNRHARYAAYVAEGIDRELERFYKPGRPISPILGGKDFRLLALEGLLEEDYEFPELRQAREYPMADTIIGRVAAEFEVPTTIILESRRGRASTSPARAVAMYLCREAGGMALKDIASLFGLARYSSVGSAITDLKRRLETDRSLARSVNRLFRDLTTLPDDRLSGP